MAARIPSRSMVASPEPARTGFFRGRPATVTVRSAGIVHDPAGGGAEHREVGGDGDVPCPVRDGRGVRGEHAEGDAGCLRSLRYLLDSVVHPLDVELERDRQVGDPEKRDVEARTEDLV